MIDLTPEAYKAVNTRIKPINYRWINRIVVFRNTKRFFLNVKHANMIDFN